jgi:predicted phosphate transport protein (TIGR00153 family)
MGLQDLIRWILPREDVFYGLIERQSEKLDEAAKALAQFTRGVPAEQIREQVQDIEHQADAIVYEIEEQFARVFVTPIDREDLQLLAASLDDVVDLINLTARTFVLFGVPEPTPPMTELLLILVKLAEVFRAALPALRKHDYAALIAAGRVIKEHEKEADRVFRNALGQLFHDPNIDAKVLLRDKEVLEDLERAIDKCETVAERLKNLAVKHG